MAGYTKLFNSILASTIWRAPDKTRIVWITLLAMADKDGVAEGSMPGLADLARVSLDDCQKALAELAAPDEHSRSPEFDGRRIEPIQGTGWRLLNHGKYRAKLNEDERREYNRRKQREWRDRQKLSTDVNYSQSQSAMSAQPEAAPAPTPEAVTTSKGGSSVVPVVSIPTLTLSGKPDVSPPNNLNGYKLDAIEILGFLNTKTGRKYQAVKVNLDFIVNRLKEGATKKQCFQVIAKKCTEWGTDEKMSQYLRPATLFNKTKFAQYVGELVAPKGSP